MLVSADAQTRRVAHVPPAPGPMPPRWERWPPLGLYMHDTGLTVDLDGGMASAGPLRGVPPPELEFALRDAADLVAWLRRGGR